VTCKDWSQIWLNESFATYSETLWRERSRGRDEARFLIFQDFLAYLREDQKSHRRPIICRRYRYSEEVMDRHAYEKGACVLDMLRTTLGDDAFFRSLAHHLKKHSFGVAETSDFRNSIEEATGKNLYWFFDQWLSGAGHPELEVGYDWERENAQLRLKVKQVQTRDEKTPLFRLPVEIEITTDAGPTSYRITVEKEEQEFYFSCTAKPRMVLFDKGHRIFKLLRFQKSAQELIYQLEHDDDLMGRARAARELAVYKTEEVAASLREKVFSRDFWGVRMTAALSLGEIGTAGARAAIEEGFRTSDDSRVRRGCVWALGNFKDDETVDLLRAALDDQSYFVAVAAVRSLANIGGDRAYDILAAALSRTSWQEVIRAAVFHGFSLAKEKRAVEPALSHSRYGEHLAVRVAAISCLGALGKELHKNGEAERIVDRLIELLLDKSIRARVTAIRALGGVGHQRALGPLREAQRRECLDQLRGALEDAFEAFEKKDKDKDKEKDKKD
jgi:aminopeptidase N